MISITEVQDYLDFVQLDKSSCTVNSYELAIRKFFEFLNINAFEDIKNITPNDCRKFQAYIVTSGSKKSSANQYVRALKAFFNFLLENESIDRNPFNVVKFLKQEKTIPVFLSEVEISTMVNACEKVDDLPILALLLTTGLRRNELVTLKLSDIVDGHILVNGKGSKQRNLPLQDQVISVLNKYIEYRNNKYSDKVEYLFVSKMGCGYSGEAIRLRIQTIGKRAGIPQERLEKIHVHSMRHTFCANMIDSGAEMRVIQGSMGHSNIKTTQIYAHLRDSTLDAAMLNQKSIFN